MIKVNKLPENIHHLIPKAVAYLRSRPEIIFIYLFGSFGRGRVYAIEYWNKIYLIWDGLTKKRTDGALIRVNNPVTKNSDEALQIQT